MGLFDDLKAKLGPVKDKVGGLVQQHGDKIGQGLDKAARVVDAKTDGKYSSQIRTGTGKAKEALVRLADSDGAGDAKGSAGGKDGGAGSGTS
ncbi:antitoxin [Streptomyces sp. I05A-00742]|uniref:antitoxin n=1 Tax=Streptomyces sp. I05A-00742 TaxID=2732853 RepID=UPI00148A0CB7|nr:antitoxin [Streptomyces sp. I05A-00742]